VPGIIRLKKALRLLSRPLFTYSALRHGVAAATEHLSVIRQTAAATLIDIGANKGQFSLAFRGLQPQARIIAFEPLPEAAETYLRVFAGDEGVELHRVAIGETEGELDFHVTNRTDSSSLLAPGPAQEIAFGVSEDRTISVRASRLESCIQLSRLEHPILMKIDVQGAELQVVRGCDQLEAADYIYVELSFLELYEGQATVEQVFDYLGSRGFRLIGVFNQVSTLRYGPTQADFLFARAS
jgi:FkbM family methyltransferase